MGHEMFGSLLTFLSLFSFGTLAGIMIGRAIAEREDD